MSEPICYRGFHIHLTRDGPGQWWYNISRISDGRVYGGNTIDMPRNYCLDDARAVVDEIISCPERYEEATAHEQ